MKNFFFQTATCRTRAASKIATFFEDRNFLYPRSHLNGVKMQNQCKTKDSEIKSYALCLGNISEDVIVDNMKKMD